MPARKPEELDALFGEALNAGDLERLMALYEPAASIIPETGRSAQGHAAIRQVLQGFVAMKPTVQISPTKIGDAGDLALVSGRWTLDGTGEDGKPVRLEGRSVEVARRQPDGSWLYVMDAPFGVG